MERILFRQNRMEQKCHCFYDVYSTMSHLSKSPSLHISSFVGLYVHLICIKLTTGTHGESYDPATEYKGSAGAVKSPGYDAGVVYT